MAGFLEKLNNMTVSFRVYIALCLLSIVLAIVGIGLTAQAGPHVLDLNVDEGKESVFIPSRLEKTLTNGGLILVSTFGLLVPILAFVAQFWNVEVLTYLGATLSCFVFGRLVALSRVVASYHDELNKLDARNNDLKFWEKTILPRMQGGIQLLLIANLVMWWPFMPRLVSFTKRLKEDKMGGRVAYGCAIAGFLCVFAGSLYAWQAYPQVVGLHEDLVFDKYVSGYDRGSVVQKNPVMQNTINAVVTRLSDAIPILTAEAFLVSILAFSAVTSRFNEFFSGVAILGCLWKFYDLFLFGFQHCGASVLDYQTEPSTEPAYLMTLMATRVGWLFNATMILGCGLFVLAGSLLAQLHFNHSEGSNSKNDDVQNYMLISNNPAIGVSAMN